MSRYYVSHSYTSVNPNTNNCETGEYFYKMPIRITNLYGYMFFLYVLVFSKVWMK